MIDPCFLGKPEVFWVGMQAICAVLGVIGLAVYTYYARQQATYAQETLRASLTPYITVASQHPKDTQKGTLEFESYIVTYRNVGPGVALRLRSWHRYADKSVIEAFKAREIIKPENGTSGVLDREDLPRDGVTVASFNEYREGSDRLYVLEAEDQAGGFYQIQVLVGVQGDPQVHNLSIPKASPRFSRSLKVGASHE